MSNVIRLYKPRLNALDVCRQEYEFVEQHCMAVMERFDPIRQASVTRLESARAARDEAFARYMSEVRAS